MDGRSAASVLSLNSRTKYLSPTRAFTSPKPVSRQQVHGRTRPANGSQKSPRHRFGFPVGPPPRRAQLTNHTQTHRRASAPEVELFSDHGGPRPKKTAVHRLAAGPCQINILSRNKWWQQFSRPLGCHARSQHGSPVVDGLCCGSWCGVWLLIANCPPIASRS